MLPIFPERMLDGSIHTAVLLGLLLLWLATESLGWVFAGFVVPGYLAAIGVVAPVSLVAIVVEAVITYGIVWFLGVGTISRGTWARVFGRERFLLFVLVSIPVRLVVEGLAAPHFEVLLAPLLDDPTTNGSRFFGIGVVLVPLVANAFWKIGLSRGVLQLGLVALGTWALLVGVIGPFTNFSFTAFELTFEDVAVDFMSSPKVYVVLICTAFFAARNTARFGWDFGGIMVPALLAIVAFEPTKLLSTLVEIGLLVTVYRLLLRLPGVRRMNLEGPRRIVSMYVVAYGLKYLLAMGAQTLSLPIYVSDYYGFGFLLTSLVAVRIHQRGNLGRTLTPLLWTTGQGLIGGLLISAALNWVLPETPEEVRTIPAEMVDRPLERSVLLSRGNVRESVPSTEGTERAWRNYVEDVGALVSAGPGIGNERVGRLFNERRVRIGRAWRADGQPCVTVQPTRREASVPSGLPSVWWCGGNGPILYVPRPVGDPDAVNAAAWLAWRSRVAGVIIEGIDESESGPIAGAPPDPFVRERFLRLRRRLGANSVLVLRTQEGGGTHVDPRSARTRKGIATMGGPLSSTDFRFEENHGLEQELWEQLPARDGLLTIGLDDLDAMISMERAEVVQRPLDEAPVAQDALESEEDAESDVPGDGLNHKFLEAPTLEQALAALPHRLPARTESADEGPDGRDATVDVLLATALRRARAKGAGILPPSLVSLAEGFGVDAVQVLDSRGRTCWVLAAREDGPAGWGTWVLHPGARSGWVVAAPFSAEEMGTGNVAMRFFEDLDARAVWVSRHDSQFGTGNALFGDVAERPMELMALWTALRGSDPTAGSDPELLMIRSQPVQARPIEAVLVSRGPEIVMDADALSIRARLRPTLDSWPVVGADDGRLVTAPLNTSSQFPVRYLEAVREGHAVVLWIANRVLWEVSGTPNHAIRTVWYRSLGVPVVAPDSPLDPRHTADRSKVVERPELFRLLRHHADTRAEVSLEELRRVGNVVIVDDGIRLSVVVQQGDAVCTTVALGDDGAAVWPLNGCWEVAP